ncbi:MAG: GTP-binding protein [Pseudomonadota bacterium]|nr:GTP-binding protein [Pseudomonadota bacterium]
MIGAADPLPVTVIGGYLGAGKTTLVNSLLRQANGQRLAVLVNEFGELPIDADLIEGQDENVINIAGGCICCSYGSDLIMALQDLEQLELSPDHLLIEASGVAMPDAIAQSTTLIAGYTVNGIVVMADADTVRQHGTDKYLADTIAHQLGAADIVLLNKVDLPSLNELNETRHWLGDFCADAQIVETEMANVSLPALLGVRLGLPALDSGHRHPHAHHETVVLSVNGPVDPCALVSRLSALAHGLVRTKGFVTGLDGQTYVVQTVGRRCTVVATSQPVEEVGRIICISCGGAIDQEALETMIGQIQSTGT